MIKLLNFICGWLTTFLVVFGTISMFIISKNIDNQVYCKFICGEYVAVFVVCSSTIIFAKSYAKKLIKEQKKNVHK